MALMASAYTTCRLTSVRQAVRREGLLSALSNGPRITIPTPEINPSELPGWVKIGPPVTVPSASRRGTQALDFNHQYRPGSMIPGPA